MTVPIVALDVARRESAVALLDLLGPGARWVKVGLQLFTAAGPEIVRDLKQQGLSVFLDLKLHDIPNTVAGAVHAAADIGADLLTVHASGGEAMLRAAADAAGRRGPRIFAVTVLTSLAAEPDEIHRRCEAALRAGIRGVVASVEDVEPLRRAFGRELAVLCPGIRLPGGDAHDQARIATPERAIEVGADFIVVGRAVTAAPDPRAALDQVLAAL